ncbi:MAG: ferredoxin [Candidatus Asgardarchaeia archaeon]
MAKYKIVHDREECVGDGICATLCPDNWEMAEDGFADPLTVELDDLGCNMDAAENCPTQCIHIIDTSTNKCIVHEDCKYSK